MNRRELIMGAGFALAAGAIAPKAQWLVHKSGLDTIFIPKVEFWDIGGSTMFPLMGENGSYRSIIAVYPYFHESDTVVVYGYHNTLLHKVSWQGGDYDAHIQVDARASFLTALQNGMPVDARYEGDYMPKDGEIVRFHPKRA